MSGSVPFVSRISPWTAQPLTDASKDAKLRATLNLTAERVIYGRQAIIAGWGGLGIGASMMALSIAGWVMVLPLKTIQTEIWVADRSTGIITKPISVSDAPTQFSPAMDEHALYTLIMAREAWVYERDREDDHMAKIMSSPEEQARINAARQKPGSNAVDIGEKGHVVIENQRYFLQATDKDSKTHRYLVRFTRTVWRGSTPDPSETWTASVDFQWHPERAMNPADRALNPGGFVAIAYSSKSDIPDKRRQ